METVKIIGMILFLIMFSLYVIAYKSNLTSTVNSVC